MQPSRRWLFWIVIANVAATVLHYADNILAFAQDPEPPWMSPHLVDAFWFFMTPFAVAGYVLIRRANVHCWFCEALACEGTPSRAKSSRVAQKSSS